MKKACIALAALFLVSALLTVSLGAAIGARELRGILEGNSRLGDWMESIGNWHGQLEKRHEGMLLGETRTNFPFNSMEAIFLSFEVAQVHARPSEDGTASMHIQYYGSGQIDNLSSLPYAEQKEDGLHLGVHIPDNLRFTSVTVELSLPEVKIASLHAQVATGELTIENMQFGALEAGVDVGEIRCKSSSADTAKLSTDTGDLIWEGTSKAAQSLSMQTGVGEIQLAWPSSVGFQLQYQTKTGEFTNLFEEAVTEQSETLAVLSKGTLRFGDAGCSVTLSAGVGDITLRPQAAQE